MPNLGKPETPEERHFSRREADVAKSRLTRRISELRALDPEAFGYLGSAEIALRTAGETVRAVFGEGSVEYQIYSTAIARLKSTAKDEITSIFKDDAGRSVFVAVNPVPRVREAIARLGTLLDAVDENTTDDDATARALKVGAPSRRVFVVHGHNEEVKQTVARTLEWLDIEPIILHERSDRGRAIIEKFEAYADVKFAVILMTGDDRGGPNDADPATYSYRARQNVVLEMGFFLGRLGRDRVCVLYQDDVEIPSDYSGVLFKPLDEGGAWKFDLAGEINAAGISVDANRLLKKT